MDGAFDGSRGLGVVFRQGGAGRESDDQRADFVHVDLGERTGFRRFDHLRQRWKHAFQNRLLVLLTSGGEFFEEYGQVFLEFRRRRIEPQQQQSREKTAWKGWGIEAF